MTDSRSRRRIKQGPKGLPFTVVWAAGKDKPIKVKAGKTYSFQVISLNSASEASDLSPVATFKP